MVQANPVRRRKAPPALLNPSEVVLVAHSSPLKMPLRKVSESFFMGSYEMACNLSVLRSEKITHILNLTGDTSRNRFEGDFQYLTIRMRDNPGTEIFGLISEAVGFIHGSIATGGNVLVHCAKGKSRAPTVACAYLIWRDGISFESAFEYLKEVEPRIDPNLGFISELKEYTVMAV